MQHTAKVKNNTPTSFAKILVPLIGLLLVGALLAGLLYFKKGNSDVGLVDNSKKQAVYLKGGQIFFGDITDIDKNFLTLDDVYYLQVSDSAQQQEGSTEDGQDSQGSSISLTKRGCEIAAPEKSMYISRDEVSYFENLKDDSDVTEGIEQWVEDNPNGLDCG